MSVSLHLELEGDKLIEDWNAYFNRIDIMRTLNTERWFMAWLQRWYAVFFRKNRKTLFVASPLMMATFALYLKQAKQNIDLETEDFWNMVCKKLYQCGELTFRLVLETTRYYFLYTCDYRQVSRKDKLEDLWRAWWKSSNARYSEWILWQKEEVHFNATAWDFIAKFFRRIENILMREWSDNHLVDERRPNKPEYREIPIQWKKKYPLFDLQLTLLIAEYLGTRIYYITTDNVHY